MATIRRTSGGRFHELARRITQGDTEERKIATSWRLKESIVLSLDSFSKALGVSKSEILNEVLETGLTELSEVLKSTRPDLAEVREGEPYDSFPFETPAAIRYVRESISSAFQTDLEEHIAEAENTTQTTEEEE